MNAKRSSRTHAGSDKETTSSSERVRAVPEETTFSPSRTGGKPPELTSKFFEWTWNLTPSLDANTISASGKLTMNRQYSQRCHVRLSYRDAQRVPLGYTHRWSSVEPSCQAVVQRSLVRGRERERARGLQISLVSARGRFILSDPNPSQAQPSGDRWATNIVKE